MTAGGASFGALLRRLRRVAGLSQEALAERAGISARGLSDLERGVSRTARAGSARLLADALALSGPERERFFAASGGFPTPGSPAVGVLPVPPTPLIGRDAELAAVERLLDAPGARLVTLTGVGGIGKTRLALEVAARMADRFPDGVWFVDLAPLADETLVIAAIARTLALSEGTRRSLADAVALLLEEKRALLVLDNFEHVLGAAGRVADLRDRCPAVSILVTSRTLLRLPGERDVAIPPLAVPPHDGSMAFADLRENAAVTLFVERARAVRADFALSPENARTVAEICQRLDGLPLAIELAAARTLLLSPAAIVSRLESRMTLLTGGARDLPKRHQTLRDSIDWSYQLLERNERALFRALGVFAGGATLAAALAVCGEREIAADALAGVEALAGWGLVWRETRPSGEGRLRMLETIREYALARLAEAGEEARARQAHALFYLELAERIEPDLSGPDQAIWLDLLDAELDNVRGALTRTIGAGDGTSALRLAGALWWFWETRGLYAEGQAWLERALAVEAGGEPRWRARALFGAGGLAYRRRDLEKSETFLTTALELYRAVGDAAGASWCHSFLGLGALVRGEHERSEALHEAALAEARRARDTVVVAGTLSNLGEVAHARGDLARAEALYEESLAVARSVANPLVAARSLTNLGIVAGESGRPLRAAELHHEALGIYSQIGDRRGIASSLEGLAAADAAIGQAAAAVRLYGAAAALHDAVGSPVPVVERAMHEWGMAAVKARLSGSAFQAAWDAGYRQSPGEAIAEALEMRDDAVTS